MPVRRATANEVWIATGLAGVATAIGVKVAEVSHLPLALGIVVTAIFPAASTLLVTFTFALLRNTERGRRWLAAANWIEGYWHIVTLSAPNDARPVPSGLMYVHYQGANNDLVVVVYRQHSDQGRRVISSSESTLAYFRDDDHRFMNVCVQRWGGNEDQAIGVGTFLRDGTSEYPTFYEGWMIRATEGIYRRQLAWRIPPDVIASAKNAQGEGLSWISRVIDGQDKLAKTTGRIRSRQGRGT
ncbi:MAG: hypothetical protein ACLPN6_18715 [Streptosporangiaceae bacterium]|jgi:hypothetical protein